MSIGDILITSYLFQMIIDLKESSMKKLIPLGLLLVFVLGIVLYKTSFSEMERGVSIYRDKDSIEYMSKAESDSFYIYKNKEWNKVFIKGVNIGASKPGYFPGEFGITKEEYLRWFQYISDMNANTIRVYTILKPDFYDALIEFNSNAKNPLYLIQGVWVNEDAVADYQNAYNPEIKDRFESDIKTVIDVLHGNKVIKQHPGLAYGIYNSDVSPYVLGYILGIEWDPAFVENTNNSNPDQTRYNGSYLYSENASPFENFLCEEGNICIEYETDNYGMQKAISFTNWVTTDMLNHENEPLPNEDLVSVNPEHIKKKETFKPGLFASYHIYPYYPDSMNYQKDYINFRDEDGKINTYRAYLRDLKKHHTIPVLVAEFGVPSSRGKAHDSLYLGYNQGNISETQQGEMDAAMLQDIYKERYAGGLVFSFQDEWFKRTWNTMDLDIPDRRPYWNNQQTNEQHFGVLAFDSGQSKSICYVDGNTDDWVEQTPLATNGKLELYVKSDETYVYFMIKNYRLDADGPLLIPIDTVPNQGSLFYGKTTFDRNADFVISVDGRDHSRILVDPYYDSFQYIYGENLSMIPKTKNFYSKDSGEFVPMYLCTNKELTLPQDKTKVPFQKYETGALLYGDGDPESSGYNSLSDFCAKENALEIRIPWQLLNMMDPSTLSAMDDLHINGIQPIKIQGIYAGVGLNSTQSALGKIAMNQYAWSPWDVPVYHERLKPSYYILKEAFAKY
jgi:hypothetical protein